MTQPVSMNHCRSAWRSQSHTWQNFFMRRPRPASASAILMNGLAPARGLDNEASAGAVAANPDLHAEVAEHRIAGSLADDDARLGLHEVELRERGECRLAYFRASRIGLGASVRERAAGQTHADGKQGKPAETGHMHERSVADLAGQSSRKRIGCRAMRRVPAARNGSGRISRPRHDLEARDEKIDARAGHRGTVTGPPVAALSSRCRQNRESRRLQATIDPAVAPAAASRSAGARRICRPRRPPFT
jgi:hypothetical protein